MQLAGPVGLTTLASAIQALLAARVFTRMLAGAAGDPIVATAGIPPGSPQLAVLVPVLDERDRIGGALAGLVAQPATLAQIVIVDGGSTDGTQAIVRRFAAADPRVVLIDASPAGAGWNGKMWNLAAGLAAVDPALEWVACLDADVTVEPWFTASLLAHARTACVDAFSAAPRFRLSGALEAALHPAFLASLVYRRGLPGGVARNVRDVQANGQCFVARRALLARSRAFAAAKGSRCDDYTVARALVAGGAQVGFYEGAALASVRMYASARECWRNWPRSLPLRDAQTPLARTLGALAEIAFVQALPLAVVLATLVARRSTASVFFRLNVALLIARLGVLAGTARAYERPGPAYALSIFADLPVAFAIARSAFARRATWRGRELVAA